MAERMVTLTVYAIEADQIDATTYSDPPGSRYLNGQITVKAQGEGLRAEWVVPWWYRCWPGDRVTVSVLEDDPEPFVPTVDKFTPPPIDKRTQ